MEEFHGPAKPGEQKRSVIDYSQSPPYLTLGACNAVEKGLEQTVDYFREK